MVAITDANRSRGPFAKPSSSPSRIAASAGAGASPAASAPRMKLFVLVRILLQYLDRVDEPSAELARETMRDCERKRLGGDSKYRTLADAIRCRLRDAVGEAHWEHARRIQRRVFINQHRRNALASLERESSK